jgi:Fe-S cluster assembly protein SufD
METGASGLAGPAIGECVTETATEAGFTRQALEGISRRAGTGRLAGLRVDAFERFEAAPMPSPETEEWRYTDLQDLDLGAYEPFHPETPVDNLDTVAPGVLGAAGDMGERSGLSIQHNSMVVTTHLDSTASGRGVIFTSLERAATEHPDLLEGKLHEAVPAYRTKFTALHAAFRSGGTFVHVPRDVRVELPLQTLTYVDRDGLAVFPHTVIVLDEGAELTYIDRYVSPALERALSDAVVEIHAGPNSRLQYVVLQEWGEGMTHLSVQRAILARDAEVRSLAVALGASLARAEAESLLLGDGSSSEMLGMYFGDGSQHVDHRSIQDHVGSRTSSDLLYKGALKGSSRAIYTGTVVIQKGAHQCDAYQTNRNVLLSETAKAHSVPNLEILSNDPVRCGHAASVGPVSEDELFYLQTRGIPREEAERLIVFGFFREVLDRVEIEEIRRDLDRAIELELERGS